MLETYKKVLDPVGHEAWMPRETRYTVLFRGVHVTGQLAQPLFVLLSKALKAPTKNKALIVEYLASGPPREFFQLATKYGLQLERFVS